MPSMNSLLSRFADPTLSRGLLQKVREKAVRYKKQHGRSPVMMEVCGSHTVSLAKSGIKQALHNEITFIAGPGCPVCVTDQSDIDQMIRIADEPGVIVCTFGDMLRVPGSHGSLLTRKSAGADIRMIYNPVEAVVVAQENPDKKIVLLGIGFETTMPLHAAALKLAVEQDIHNFSIWMAAKLVPPIMHAILASAEVKIDSFLLPGHASVVLGRSIYDETLAPYQIPGAIAGFEPVEMLGAVYKILTRLIDKTFEIDNCYPMVVREEGNPHAKSLMEQYFTPCGTVWRGMGSIPQSGLMIREEYSSWDARKIFSGLPEIKPRKTACRCGDILRGTANPADCPLFAKACAPANPIGPCMVSGEGACGAYFQYLREDILV
ncbi:hydrogenase formation protein HypD [Aneurinibacillus terranovensis]|uniref:hydrogenase formation protein HypD n=1 Tax=Aneurinibacillus terranovensis TaxID=278991 RepID=UPI0004259CFD|nr:hydrogenase formation protein HypD [Aneurinibacillus terranovensis]